MSDPISALDEETLGFEPGEVTEIITDYVCAVCHSTLISFQIPNERRMVICCLEHGSVEKCGRVMKSTVSIENERAYIQYKMVVQNLKDLWGDLIETGFTVKRSTALKIVHENVCRKCGGGLGFTYSSEDGFFEITCGKCGSIDVNGYVKEKSYANLRTHR